MGTSYPSTSDWLRLLFVLLLYPVIATPGSRLCDKFMRDLVYSARHPAPALTEGAADQYAWEADVQAMIEKRFKLTNPFPTSEPDYRVGINFQGDLKERGRSYSLVFPDKGPMEARLFGHPYRYKKTWMVDFAPVADGKIVSPALRTLPLDDFSLLTEKAFRAEVGKTRKFFVLPTGLATDEARMVLDPYRVVETSDEHVKLVSPSGAEISVTYRELQQYNCSYDPELMEFYFALLATGGKGQMLRVYSPKIYPVDGPFIHLKSLPSGRRELRGLSLGFPIFAEEEDRVLLRAVMEKGWPVLLTHYRTYGGMVASVPGQLPRLTHDYFREGASQQPVLVVTPEMDHLVLRHELIHLHDQATLKQLTTQFKLLIGANGLQDAGEVGQLVSLVAEQRAYSGMFRDDRVPRSYPKDEVTAVFRHRYAAPVEKILDRLEQANLESYREIVATLRLHEVDSTTFALSEYLPKHFPRP